MRNELLDEVSCTACICYVTHVTACVKLAVLKVCPRLWITVEVLEAVEYDVMVETWVTILEWISWVIT